MLARSDEIAGIADEMIVQMGAMRRIMAEINEQLENYGGTRYERRVARNIRGVLRRSFGLSQVRVVHRDWGDTDDGLSDLLDDADERGAITREERDDVLDADLIAAGANPDGQRVYVLVEVGFTVADADVNRAARRARTVAKATDAECNALVVGSEIPDHEYERARRAGVTIVAMAAAAD